MAYGMSLGRLVKQKTDTIFFRNKGTETMHSEMTLPLSNDSSPLQSCCVLSIVLKAFNELTC
jgi:hypothetical protein